MLDRSWQVVDSSAPAPKDTRYSFRTCAKPVAEPANACKALELQVGASSPSLSHSLKLFPLSPPSRAETPLPPRAFALTHVTLFFFQNVEPPKSPHSFPLSLYADHGAAVDDDRGGTAAPARRRRWRSV